MSFGTRYVIVCPNCNESDKLQETGYNYFECKCGEDFDIDRASTEDIETIDVINSSKLANCKASVWKYRNAYNDEVTKADIDLSEVLIKAKDFMLAQDRLIRMLDKSK